MREQLTEGDVNRGTTSASPPPHGMRPHRVQQHPIAVTGEPDTFLIGETVQKAAPGCILLPPPLPFSPSRGSLCRRHRPDTSSLHRCCI